MNNIEKIEKIVVEIKSAEGGDDAKLFVQDLYTAYKKFAIRRYL
jgi:protein subunit release factor A